MKRRQFLTAGLASMGWFSLSRNAPAWFTRSAAGACDTCLGNEKILVVLQLAGGNDGLNTVVPYTDAAYYAARPTLGVPANSVLNLDGLNGLHPKLSRIANWFDQGRMGVLHNIGYVNPNLSHFVSTDYYELGGVPGEPIPSDGWIARYYDHACTGCASPAALTMAAAGISATPKSMIGSDIYTPPAISDPNSYEFTAALDPNERFEAIMSLNNIPTNDTDLSYVQSGYNVATASVQDIATAVAVPGLVADGTYPTDSLGNGLKLVSQIIRAGFPTRIFYVSQGGYDTHSGQVAAGATTDAGDHPQLLDAFDRSVDAFLTEMSLSGNLDRVVVMTYSEFGRRVGENGSLGTDHGAGNSSFVFGGINPGIYGGQPNLTDLINGSLKHNVDFRAVYTMALEGLFGASTAAVFGQKTYDDIIVPDLVKIPYLTRAAATISGLLVR